MVSSAVTTIIPNVVFFIVKIIGIFYILITIDILFALVFVVGGALVFLASSLFKPVTKRMHKRVQETDGKVRSFMQEGLSSLLMVKTFEAQDKMSATADALQKVNYEAKRKRNIFSICTGTAVSAVFSFAFVWGLGWGAYMLYYGLISYGVLMQIITLIGQIRTPIQGMSNIFPTYFNALASAERIMEIEELPDEEVINSDLDIKALYDDMREIRFDDISFAFDRDKVLESYLACGEERRICSHRGYLRNRKKHPVKAAVERLSAAIGRDPFIRIQNDTLLIKAPASCFPMFRRATFLLSGTLRENVAFVAPDATDDDIMKAARIACADEFISELPMDWIRSSQSAAAD